VLEVQAELSALLSRRAASSVDQEASEPTDPGAVLGHRVRQHLRHPTGRGRLPRLDLDYVPAATPTRGDRRPVPTCYPPARVKPELVATAPNRCWSWDITKLAGPGTAGHGSRPQWNIGETCYQAARKGV